MELIHIRISISFIIVLSILQGCTFLGPMWKQSETPASQCLSELLNKNSAIKRCKGIAKISAYGFDIQVNERVAFISEYPHCLRAEMLSPFGGIGSPFTLVCNENQIYITGRILPEPYAFKPDGFLLKKILPIKLMPNELISCLNGQLPIDKGMRARFDHHSSQQILWLTKGFIWKKKHKIVFYSKSNDVQSFETYDRFNALIYRLYFDDYRKIGQFLIPFKIRFSNDSNQSIVIDMQSYWVNKPINNMPFQTEILDETSQKGKFSCINFIITRLFY